MSVDNIIAFLNMCATALNDVHFKTMILVITNNFNTNINYLNSRDFGNRVLYIIFINISSTTKTYAKLFENTFDFLNIFIVFFFGSSSLVARWRSGVSGVRTSAPT